LDRVKRFRLQDQTIQQRILILRVLSTSWDIDNVFHWVNAKVAFVLLRVKLEVVLLNGDLSSLVANTQHSWWDRARSNDMVCCTPAVAVEVDVISAPHLILLFFGQSQGYPIVVPETDIVSMKTNFDDSWSRQSLLPNLEANLDRQLREKGKLSTSIFLRVWQDNNRNSPGFCIFEQ
jgi:hypothetical protein